MKSHVFLVLAAGAIAIHMFWSNPVEATQIPLTKETKATIEKVIREIQTRGEYVRDQDQYGVRDFGIDLRKSNWKGDCEDWALAYKNAINEALPGYQAALKVMLVKKWDPENWVNQDHAALFIETDKRTYVVEGPAYSKLGKMYTRMKDVRATEYSDKRIVGEIEYKQPMRLSFVEDGSLPASTPAAKQ